MNLRKILTYALGPVGAGFFGLFTLPVMTWFFSVEDIGRVSMLQVFTSFSTLLFCLGLDQAYVREYHESNNTPKLLKSCISPGLFILIITYIFTIAFRPTFIAEVLFSISSSFLSFLCIICFTLAFLSRFLALKLRMDEKALAFSLSQISQRAFFLIMIFIIVWFGHERNIFSITVAHTISITATFLTLALSTRSEWTSALKHSLSIQQIKTLLKFGLPLVIGGLASWGLSVMDRLFLRSLSTFSELGVYSITMNIASAITIFSTIFNTIWSPMIFKWIKNGEDLNRIDVITEHLLAFVYFIIVFSGLFSWILPYLLPPEYSSIEILIIPCLIAPLFYTLSESTSVGIAVSRKTSFSMLASLGAVTINAIGNYFLIPHLGALGAALSTAIAFWCFFILRTEFSRKAWRQIPIFKNYLTCTVLLVIIIFNSIALKSQIYSIFTWFIAGLCGIYFFQKSCRAFLNLVKTQLGIA